MPWSCLICFIFSFAAHAETSVTAEVGLSVGSFSPAESKLNPGNHVFENPGWDNLMDVRGELKALGKSTKFVLRPRWLGDSRTIQYTDTKQVFNRAKGKWDLTDAYFEWTLMDNFQWTAGLFVDGWGPAEFVNPTNPFFHLNLQSKSFFYKEKGHVLAKAVWNPTPKTTLALVSEPTSNREPNFRAEQNFNPQWALRGEWQSRDVSKLLGFIGGQEQEGVSFIGEYLQFRSDRTGLSIYFEARHMHEPSRFNIEDQGLYQQMNLRIQKDWPTYSVAGLRWEGRADARLEWIYYELGYTEKEWDQILTSITQVSPALLSNFEKFSRPGLEFLTKNWWSLSVRLPDLGPKKDWQWTNRLLLSMGDKAFGSSRGGLFQSDLEMPAFQAWTFFAETQTFFGKSDTELVLNSRQSYFLGARWAW